MSGNAHGLMNLLGADTMQETSSTKCHIIYFTCHLDSSMNKLTLQNRAELGAYAVQQGLMSGHAAK
jgi:hypothetical protein